jgi:hypothetical protein
MLKVFVAQHHAEAHFVNGLLRSHGIDSEVRGEALFTTVEAASVLPGGTPEVWVLNPSQVPQALGIIRQYSDAAAAPQPSGPAWLCPNCGESLEPQFTSCWQCGSAKPSPAPVPQLLP